MSALRLLAANLKRVRTERKLGQHALAELSGVSRSTIAAIELCRYASFEMSTVERLAAALKIESTDLLRSKSVKTA